MNKFNLKEFIINCEINHDGTLEDHDVSLTINDIIYYMKLKFN